MMKDNLKSPISHIVVSVCATALSVRHLLEEHDLRSCFRAVGNVVTQRYMSTINERF